MNGDETEPTGGGRAAGEPPRTEAAIHRTRWPGWIWAVPLAVLCVVVWLVLRHFAQEGPEVTVTFHNAEGVKADDTKVKYRGIEVGKVEDVALADDLGHVVLTLRFHQDVAKALRSGTRFWIAGAKPKLSDLSSLTSVIAGPHIGMDPGDGPPADKFTGLEAAPQVMSGTPGREFILQADSLGSVASGSTISHHGLEVGKVETTTFLGEGKGFEIRAFVRAPYDRLVHDNTRFWAAGAVGLSMGANGVQAHLASLPALFNGAIDFDVLDGMPAGPQAAAETRFSLYDGKDAAKSAPIGPEVPFRIRFDGAVGGLSPGAAVKLQGFRIGRVTAVGLDYDVRTGRLATPVSIEIEPARLTFTDLSPGQGGDLPKVVVDAVGHLVRQGLRARLESSTPVIGGKEVVLTMDSKAGTSAVMASSGGVPEIPATSSADVNALLAQAHDVLDKIDALPIDQIGNDLRDTAHRVAALVSSPQVSRSVAHLDRTLANLDKVSHDAGPQVAPLIASLRRTADAAQQAVSSANQVLAGTGGTQNRNLPQALEELTRAARAVRDLASYLDQHPEALIAGRGP